MAVLADNPKASADIRIVVRQTLGYALCGAKRCGEAIPVMKDGLALTQANFGPESLEAGVAAYGLGLVSWHSGDMVDAAVWLK